MTVLESNLDLSFCARDGDLILVHEGYHTVAAAPETNAYYLQLPRRRRFARSASTSTPDYAWVADDWKGRPTGIPVGGRQAGV